MHCTKCGKENEGGKNFCAFCGAPLGAFCDRCQHIIKPSDQFCGNCGLTLASSLSQKPADKTPMTRQVKKTGRQYSPQEIEELLSLRAVLSAESESHVKLNQDEIDSLFS
jgi:hypothetical protein